jgi:hypothetical protein
MKYRKLLTGAMICLSSTVGLVGKAEAVSWWGFSSLNFHADFTGGGKTENNRFKVEFVDAEVRAACINTQSNTSVGWQPGVGNLGGTQIQLPVVEDPSGNGHVTVKGAVSLSIYDDHDADGHIHICNSSDPNKEEVIDSAYVPQITVYWKYVKCLDLTQDPSCQTYNIIKRGYQVCDWTGSIDELGRPIHDYDGPPQYEGGFPFDCPTDIVYKK